MENNHATTNDINNENGNDKEYNNHCRLPPPWCLTYPTGVVCLKGKLELH